MITAPPCVVARRGRDEAAARPEDTPVDEVVHRAGCGSRNDDRGEEAADRRIEDEEHEVVDSGGGQRRRDVADLGAQTPHEAGLPGE
ncbi:hypothetical protein [Schaalia cardiffensis]|uniref:hypothetical protein n=1 Tax=Schaalia cardiffensis TaxID=181487 RepID=UPI0023F3FC03|nr:hypothetical protein [Schaalia cardiffensis]